MQKLVHHRTGSRAHDLYALRAQLLHIFKRKYRPLRLHAFDPLMANYTVETVWR